MPLLEYDRSLGTNELGAINEMKAVIWLMEQGYQVFTNIKGTGPADMIAWNPETDEKIVVDVKTMRIYKRHDGTLQYNSSIGSANDKRRRKFVSYLGYCPENNEFRWL
jgi:Holliday junction resolvase-like predicted endonuclease